MLDDERQLPDPGLGLVIAAGVRLYREGLAETLSRTPGFTIVRVVGDAEEAVAAAANLRPGVVLLDMSIPGSHAAVGVIRTAAPACRVVALGVGETDDDVLSCAEAGVSGYLPRGGSLEELVTTIRSAQRGELQCTPRMAASLMRRVASLAAVGHQPRSLSPLTVRERQIVRLIDAGLSNKEIAARLGIELATVKNHVHHLLDKLQVRRRADAAARVRAGHYQEPPRPTD